MPEASMRKPSRKRRTCSWRMSASYPWKHVIPPVLPLLAASAEIILLIKPQFEAGRAALGKGGIVRDETVQRDVCDAIARLLDDADGQVLGLIEIADSRR